MTNNIYTFAIFSEEFPPSRAGGIKEWAFGITENLSALGHHVTVYSKWKGKNYRRCAQ